MNTPAATDAPLAPPAGASRSPVIWHGLAWLVALAALLCVFSFYTHPDFMVGLADKLWSCF